MRRRVAWPGVAVKRAKGRAYYYWTRSDPWTRLPDPIAEPDGFMRKLAHLGRVQVKIAEGRAGTLADTVRLYRKHPDYTGRAANTKRLYDTYIDRLLLIFGSAPLPEITRPEVQRYVMDEHADTPAAANMMCRVLHILFKWAGERREGLSDPTIGIREYRGGEHEAWPENVLAAALASDDAEFRLAVHLHLYTGQRTDDVCRMAWNLVTPDGKMPVRQQKTDRALLIPLHPSLASELARTPRTAITILRNRVGRPLRPATFREWVDKFAEPFGIELVPHGLRKNAVNALLEAECSTGEVSAITGQSLAMVEHYAKQRNQPRMADAAILKWGRHEAGTGKLSRASKTDAGRG